MSFFENIFIKNYHTQQTNVSILLALVDSPENPIIYFLQHSWRYCLHLLFYSLFKFVKVFKDLSESLKTFNSPEIKFING